MRASPWLQEGLKHDGFGPHQSDGHVLDLRQATAEDELVLEDHPDFEAIGPRIAWTTTFGYILNTALTRMGGGGPSVGDHMVTGAMSPAWGIRCERRRSAHFLPKALQNFVVDGPQLFDAGWFPMPPLDQLEMCNGSRDKAVKPPLSVHDVVSVYAVNSRPPLTLARSSFVCGARGGQEEQEFYDLLGDARFRTLRQRCLVFEQMCKWGLPIPWKESHVRDLLNRLRSQEVTPHKLQLCWDTLRWFAKKFGLLAVQEEHRLLQKKQTVETGLRPAVMQPARKAKVPPQKKSSAGRRGCRGPPPSRSL